MNNKEKRMRLCQNLGLVRHDTMLVVSGLGRTQSIKRDDFATMRLVMRDDEFFRIYVHNQTMKKKGELDRICPVCKKAYKMPEDRKTPTEKEMNISGVCSDACWDEGTLVEDL